ncbi:MAG: hypothetical protein KDA24_07080 [Deltaproteobacteria bacterium]|nr:hypothetical protein [Deltaproteobacteria bacterium]
MHRLSPALLLFALLVAAPASATTMVELSQDELTYIADLVVEAEVEVVEAEREAGQNWIKSIATLKITRVLKGEAIEGDRALVREWGGRIDADETILEGAPVYTAGERVLVFLERENRPDAMWRTLGMTQGKFTLIEEVDTGRDVILKRVARSGLEFVEASVPLPAARRYSDAVIDAVIERVSMDYVPPYSRIPGVPQWKDDQFHTDALAAGQELDPRWEAARAEMISFQDGGGR